MILVLLGLLVELLGLALVAVLPTRLRGGLLHLAIIVVATVLAFALIAAGAVVMLRRSPGGSGY